MQIDSLTKRIERDGSALVGFPGAGDLVARPATVKDKALAAVSQLDANGKIIWTLRDPDEVLVARSSAVFEGELPETGWKFRVHTLTSLSPVLEIELESNCWVARVGDDELVERLYRRLLGKHVHGGMVRRFVDPEVQKQMDHDDKIFRGLVNHCNRI